jgi:hypothetical protein
LLRRTRRDSPSPRVIGTFASRVGTFASRVGAFAFIVGAFASRAGAFASRAGGFASRAGGFASRARGFASRCAAFALLVRRSESYAGSAALEKSPFAIVPGRAIPVAGTFDSHFHRCAHGAERFLETVVGGTRTDAVALRDFGPFLSREEDFADDLAPSGWQVGRMAAQSLIELLDRDP